MRKGTPLASRVAQGVSGPSSSCVWNPRVFADDARGWQCPFVLCLHVISTIFRWVTPYTLTAFLRPPKVPRHAGFPRGSFQGVSVF